jgi:hypothetical protein
MLTVDDMELMEPLRIYDKGIDEDSGHTVSDTFAGFRAQIREGQIIIPRVTAGEPLRTECEEFLSRVRGGSGAVSNGWAGAEVVASLVAADSSMANGGALTEVKAIR